MADGGGGNAVPHIMVSAQPPALSPPVLDDGPLGSGNLDFRETVAVLSLPSFGFNA
jgi:hypothetical protein